MSTIPFSEVVNVIPGVLAANGSAVDLNGLILTQNSLAPYGSILNFSTAQGVQQYFGATSTEAAIANIYFAGFSNCTKLPKNIYFTKYPETNIASWLMGGSLSNVTLGNLQTMTGTLSITVNGTIQNSGTINLSSATSFSNAASIIQNAFTSPGFTISYSSQSSSFIFTNNTTGATSTLTYAASGTLANELLLTNATGAILSEGANAANPASFMANILTINQNWATFMTTWESVIAEKEEFAQWSNSVQPRYLYVCQDSDANILNPSSTTTFGNYLQTNQLIGTCPIYGDYTHSAFVCGYAASLDFDRLNGRTTLCFRSQSGLTAWATNSTQYSAILANGYNSFGAWGSNNPANNQNWFFPGSVSGKWLWADTYLNQIWLNTNLQVAMIDLLTQIGSIPYNSAGYNLVYSACLDPINAAINFGAIRSGVQLSSAQASEIQFALGVNVGTTITAQGFYLQIQPASAQTRQTRQSPSMTLYYQDGESIQQLTLASIAIQ